MTQHTISTPAVGAHTRKPRALGLFALLLTTWLGLPHMPAHAQTPPAPVDDPSADADAATSQAAAPLPEPSSSARELFAQTKDRIVQVRVLLSSANEQSSLGSGFLVRDDGAKGAWVLTNYHVVSSLALDPDKYRIELRGTNQRTVKATLMAVDVIHDLAVLRTQPVSSASPPTAWHVLPLREEPLVQGTKVFSLGNPLELGFLISEGIYNGPVESRIYEQMLFSGAINSGMSGGPAIDAAGRVVGVNVATRRDGEALSFLVPIRYARELLDKAWRQPPPKNWRQEMAQQLLAHQAHVMKQLNGPASGAATLPFSTQKLAGRTVPTLHSHLTKCWARGRDGDKQRYERDSLDCNLNADVYIRSGFYSGTVDIQHTLLRNTKLATPQFLALKGPWSSGYRYSGSRGELTAPSCKDAYIKGQRHVYRAALCLRAYRKFDGLYDYEVQATQVDDAEERLYSTLALSGFSFEHAQLLGQRFLEQLQ